MAASTRLRALSVELEALPRAQLIAASKAVKLLAGDEAQRTGVATMHLPRRGRGRRAVRLRAVDTIRENGASTTLRVQGVPVGLWVWANTGTGAHLVGAGKTTGRATSAASIARARKRTPYLRLGPGDGDVRRGPVWHPGTRGRHVWRRVSDRSAKVVPALFRDAVHEVCR